MKNILKKSLLLLIVLSMLSIGVCAADSIEIGAIEEQSKSVTVAFNVTNLKEYDDITILVFRKTEEKPEPDKSNIVYINQFKPTDTKLTFNLLADAAEGTYEVRMGGEDIETASVSTFEIKSVMFGDVNGDGKITISDAVWILRSISGAEMASYVTIENGNINSDDKLTISDAVWILRYLSGAEIPDYVKLPKE